MTLKNAWRGVKTSILVAAVSCAGSLVLTTGCAEKCDGCGQRDCQKCEKPCDKACPEAKAEKK